MGRFESTVPFYARTRPPYGPAFFAAVAQKLALRGNERLLDLGTGPGLLALGFAPYVSEVVGVDPEPAMLAAARAAAATAGIPVQWIEGRAEALTDSVGRFDVVTIGRALHWMDPEPTRRALDERVAHDGGILTCGASSVSDGRNPWLDAYDAARKRWSEDGPHMSHTHRAAFFDDTRFRRVGSIEVEAETWVAVEHLVDRVLSMSSSSRGRVGNDELIMRATVTEALSPYGVEDRIKDVTVARAEVFASGARFARMMG